MAQVPEDVESGATSRVPGKRFRQSFAKVKKNQSSKSDASSRADITKVNISYRISRIRKQILPHYLERMLNTHLLSRVYFYYTFATRSINFLLVCRFCFIVHLYSIRLRFSIFEISGFAQ